MFILSGLFYWAQNKRLDTGYSLKTEFYKKEILVRKSEDSKDTNENLKLTQHK